MSALRPMTLARLLKNKLELRAVQVEANKKWSKRERENTLSQWLNSSNSKSSYLPSRRRVQSLNSERAPTAVRPMPDILINPSLSDLSRCV